MLGISITISNYAITCAKPTGHYRCLEGTKGTLGKGTVQTIRVRYVSSCFKPRCVRPFAKRPFAKRPFGPLQNALYDVAKDQ